MGDTGPGFAARTVEPEHSGVACQLWALFQEARGQFGSASSQGQSLVTFTALAIGTCIAAI